ncbi:uncharacterized protein LOC134132824 [Pungitius pungitius]|uniref:uncharacterized protein LOC134132824 n=1 Tax=Pungitius pungitius TaxID=134920 RepID=UPI002E0F4EB5
MDLQTYAILNGPLAVLNMVTIAFYIFCMVRPLHGEKIKQPLKLLLWTLIGSTIIYIWSGVADGFSQMSGLNFTMMFWSDLLMICSVSTSMTSSVWLNFFYCSQIVPAHSALFTWIKKNVKSIIYVFWITERIYTLLEITSMLLIFTDFDAFLSSNNFTMVDDMPEKDFWKGFKENMFLIVFSTMKTHFVFCLCVMVMSSGSTVLYLCGHMRRMAANGQLVSSPRFRNQVRVTVTGLLQGALYVFSASWIIYGTFPQNANINIRFTTVDSTVIMVYMTATLFNLGAGQAVFRQRAAHIWLRGAQCFKAPQVQQTDQGA